MWNVLVADDEPKIRRGLRSFDRDPAERHDGGGRSRGW